MVLLPALATRDRPTSTSKIRNEGVKSRKSCHYSIHWSRWTTDMAPAVRHTFSCVHIFLYMYSSMLSMVMSLTGSFSWLNQKSAEVAAKPTTKAPDITWGKRFIKEAWYCEVVQKKIEVKCVMCSIACCRLKMANSSKDEKARHFQE